MEKDENHRYVTTIIYDRRNDGEDPKEYIEDLSRAISCLKTERFLILPQVPQSFGRTESQEQISAMREIDDAVVAKWPKNTFSIPERSSFLSDLSDDSTRIDGLHRNEKGQAIEAKWITKGCRRDLVTLRLRRLEQCSAELLQLINIARISESSFLVYLLEMALAACLEEIDRENRRFLDVRSLAGFGIHIVERLPWCGVHSGWSDPRDRPEDDAGEGVPLLRRSPLYSAA